MSTISENLQTIKSSTDAIKQAIIDKGGTISGDITTWADAISGIETGGGGSSEEYVFTGSVTYNMTKITLTGQLSSKPELSPIYLVLVYLGTAALATKLYVSDISNTLTATIDAGEPLMGNEIPGICLIHQTTGKIFPVTFIQQTPIKFYLNDTEYNALSPMTWEQFVNSETYNPTLTDVNGTSYKAFLIKNGIVYYEVLYDGELDVQYKVY